MFILISKFSSNVPNGGREFLLMTCLYLLIFIHYHHLFVVAKKGKRSQKKSLFLASSSFGRHWPHI